MQNILLNIFVRFGQSALEKPRACYYPATPSITKGEDALSDGEFAIMLQEIDRFSKQLSRHPTKQAHLVSSE